MENLRKWIAYDWFKLIVALALLILFIILMLSTRGAAAPATANLPEFPTAQTALNLDADGKVLLDSQGNRLFNLSTDGKSWQPIIPGDILSGLPAGFKLARNAAGAWEVLSADGKVLHTWDMKGLKWIAAKVEDILPDFPVVDLNLNLDKDGKALLDPQGNKLFDLSADGKTWQPIIPGDILSSLPAGFKLARNAAGAWEVLDADGKVLHTWDMSGLKWIASKIEAILPEFPALDLDLKLDKDGKALLDSQGKKLFDLSADGKAWQPFIPADILSGLPEGYTLAMNASGVWEVKDAEGNILFTWDPTSFKWNPVQVAEAPAVPAETPVPATTGETPAAPVDDGSCLAPAPARLEVGKTARILTNLNMRSDPLIANNILVTNLAGEILKILGGPVCVPHEDSAYRWWQVENAAGTSGWSAENFLYGEGYFLEPVQ